MSAATACVFLLACMAVAVQGFSRRMLQVPTPCPQDAAAKLENCLTTLERVTALNLLPENCEAARQALGYATTLMRACMHSSEVLNVLSKHDLPSSTVAGIRTICMGQ